MRPHPHTRCICFLVLFGLAVGMTHAADLDSDEPIRVNARFVEANEKTGAMIYRGNVKAVQGALSIQADRVEVQSPGGKSESVRATGKPVVLRRRGDAHNEELYAEADRVDYHFARRDLDMSGNVTLRRGQDIFTAHVLHYNLESRRLNAAGRDGDDGRIHAVIHPAQTPDTPARP